MKVFSYPYRLRNIPILYFSTSNELHDLIRNKTIEIPYNSITEIEIGKTIWSTVTISFHDKRRIGIISLPASSDYAKTLLNEIPEKVIEQNVGKDVRKYITRLSLIWRIVFSTIIFTLSFKIAEFLPKGSNTQVMSSLLVVFMTFWLAYPIFYFFKYRHEFDLWLPYRTAGLEAIFILYLNISLLINSKALILMGYSFHNLASYIEKTF